MPEDFFDFQHTVGVIAHQSDVVLIWNRGSTDCDKTVIAGVTSFDTVPELVRVKTLFTKVVLLGEPPSQHIQIFG